MSVTTNRPINLGQLAAEMGADLAIDDRGVDRVVSSRTATDAAIAAAIAVHVADPLFTPDPRARDARDAIDALIAQAGGAAVVRAKLKAVVAGTDQLTAQQAQRLVAAIGLVVLRDRTDT